MLAMPFVNAVVGHRAGPGNRGRYMGIFTTTFSLSMVVAPLAGTAIYQRLGPEILWYGVGLTGVLLFGLCHTLAPAFRRERPGTA
jgi:MFS family permease